MFLIYRMPLFYNVLIGLLPAHRLLFLDIESGQSRTIERERYRAFLRFVRRDRGIEGKLWSVAVITNNLRILESREEFADLRAKGCELLASALFHNWKSLSKRKISNNSFICSLSKINEATERERKREGERL